MLLVFNITTSMFTIKLIVLQEHVWEFLCKYRVQLINMGLAKKLKSVQHAKDSAWIDLTCGLASLHLVKQLKIVIKTAAPTLGKIASTAWCALGLKGRYTVQPMYVCKSGETNNNKWMSPFVQIVPIFSKSLGLIRSPQGIKWYRVADTVLTYLLFDRL